MTHQPVDWTNRWIGGFCAVAAVGGLPVRGADYRVHPPLADILTLPAVALEPPVSAEQVRDAWSRALGGAVALVCSVERARELLLLAVGVTPGEAVGVPANADRDLVESVKRRSAHPAFYDLDADLAPALGGPRHTDPRLRWSQPVGGLGGADAATWVDCADTLPDLEPHTSLPPATLFGLHLAADPRQAGALVLFGDATLARLVAARMTPGDAPPPGRAQLQLQRLLGEGSEPGLASRQRTVLAEVARGLRDAAGLPILAHSAAGGLAHHILVRIPDESDPATFYSYVRAEQTPVRWLPELRPLHYAAVRQPGRCAATAGELARWLLVPVGPDDTDEEIKHAVLGVVKAAEYLGVRWRSDPRRAADYAAMLDELYGPGHDAYQPAFSFAAACGLAISRS